MSIDITGKKIYLSGPMTGIEDHNRAEFDKAAEHLYSKGAEEVYNPADLIDGFARSSHESCMLASIWALTSGGTELTRPSDGKEGGVIVVNSPDYDLLVSLPGWQDSAGARLERDVAVAIGMETYDIGVML